MSGVSKILAEDADPERWNVKEVEPEIKADPTRTSTLRNDAARVMRQVMKGLGKRVKELLDGIGVLFDDQVLVGGEEFETLGDGMDTSIEELQTPQDYARAKLDELFLLSDNEFVRAQIDDLVGKARERGDTRAGQEMRAIRVPGAPGPEEESVMTPKDMMIQETLANVTTDLIVSLQQKYLADVKRIVETGLIMGVSKEEIASQIKDLTGNLDWQSERIVRTELIRAYNAAMRHRLERDGVRYWQWVAAQERAHDGTGKGGRTCGICWELNGTVVRVGDPFAIHNGVQIRQPPDPHPNCRCTLRPATTKEFDEFHGFTRGDATPEDVAEILRQIQALGFEEFDVWQRTKGWSITQVQYEALKTEEHPGKRVLKAMVTMGVI